jgi:putative sterol carrier protein
VLRFLSPEWLRAFDTALRSDRELGARFVGSPIAIAQEIGDANVRYVIVLDGEGGRVETERRDFPVDVTFVCDRATAAGLAQGTLNAQRALTSGRLKLRGEVDRLGAASTALAGMGDLLAGLRADTEF